MILENVEKANQIFKRAGVQFYVRAVDRHVARSFVDLTPAMMIQWSQVFPELSPILPFMPSDAWFPGNAEKRGYEWLQSTATVYAPEHEILVWTVGAAPANAGLQPEQGRNVIMTGLAID